MRISTKGRYAMQLMLDLARYNTGERRLHSTESHCGKAGDL